MAKLLIVDDEKNIRFSLVRFFDSLGHQMSEAENGSRASGILADSRFDLVLTDFRLAEMNGLEFPERTRQIYPDTLVILMTAYARVDNAVASMKAGAYDYISKPFSLDRDTARRRRGAPVAGLACQRSRVARSDGRTAAARITQSRDGTFTRKRAPSCPEREQRPIAG
jgi:DNA-binding NtrC family response regulator